jgi:hypothetical protein
MQFRLQDLFVYPVVQCMVDDFYLYVFFAFFICYNARRNFYRGFSFWFHKQWFLLYDIGAASIALLLLLSLRIGTQIMRIATDF